MSRFGDSYDEDPEAIRYNNLYRGNVKRALRGKRGQQWLREMRAALLALPDKRLIEGRLCEHGWSDDDAPEHPAFCAVGALAFAKRVAAGEKPEDAMRDLAESDDGESGDGEFAIESEGERLGMGRLLARTFAWQNDERLADLSPEVRYAEYLEWVESKIAPRVSERVGGGSQESQP